MRQFTHGSLFAGIGGFDLGFERAGFKTVWQVEIDEYCRRLLATRFSGSERFQDVRLCWGWDAECFRVINPLPQVDVVTGGFPCQDISSANSFGKGLDGERSGLWFEYLRIIGELRPQFVVVENVPNLFSRGIERILGGLAEIGYDAEWQVISAASLGAPHIRERVWIVAYPVRDGYRGPSTADTAARHKEWNHQAYWEIGRAIANQTLATGENVAHSNGKPAGRLSQRKVASNTQSRVAGKNVPDSTRNLRRASRNERPEAPNGRGSNVADAASLGYSGPRVFTKWSSEKANGEGQAGNALAVRFGHQWTVEPNVGRVANGVPARVDRLKGLGNAVLPQIPQVIAERISEWLSVTAAT